MNAELDKLYLLMLKMGFIVLREAVGADDREWITAEVDLLHNIPSLVGEPNRDRHAYFWTGERTLYLERIEALESSHVRSRVRTYYEPIWEKMAAIIER